MNSKRQYSVNDRFLHLKPVLEKLYSKYNKRELIKPDPLQFVYNYKSRCDKELAGFLASALAYGRVGQIEKSLSKLFGIMGESPYEFVVNFGKNERNLLKNFKYRFTNGENLANFLEIFGIILKKHGNIERFFGKFLGPDDENVVGALSGFCDSLLELYSSVHKKIPDRNVKFLLASPERRSASKRLNLFLRWMVRSDNVDAGLWKSIDKSKLIVPVDVHMGRLCNMLGLCESSQASLKNALQITKSFAEIVPEDPAKYDFCLSRVGIVENCNGKYRLECEVCDLAEFCVNKRQKILTTD